MDRFSLVYDHLIEFNQLALANAEGSDDMLNRVMTKDNIGLAALLETKEAAWSNGTFFFSVRRNLLLRSIWLIGPSCLVDSCQNKEFYLKNCVFFFNSFKTGIRPDPSQIHQPLLVCTAHIHWDPQFCDVKLVQTMMLMNEVKKKHIINLLFQPCY